MAAGEFQLALGTQTIGSVIRPAQRSAASSASNRRTTASPAPGCSTSPKSLDHVGLFTQDLAGMALAASVLCAGWDADLAALEPTAPVLAVPEGPYLLRAEPEGRAAFAAQVSAWKRRGFVVKRAPFLTDFDRWGRKHRRVMRQKR
ncbi:MAG: hypothetical protein R2856_05820 [Caldilineaceae bacterium]